MAPQFYKTIKPLLPGLPLGRKLPKILSSAAKKIAFSGKKADRRRAEPIHHRDIKHVGA